MVGQNRGLLQEIADVDEASMPCRDDGGADGRILLAGAVDLSECMKPRRIRPKAIESYAAGALRGFVSEAVAPGARVVTVGRLGYSGLPDSPRVIG